MCHNKSLPLIGKNEANNPKVDTLLATMFEHHASDFLETLLICGFDSCHRDHKGDSLLHQAIALNFVNGVLLLAKYGADLNQPNLKQQTPLQISLTLGHEACSRVLIEHGATTSELDSNGNSMLDIAVEFLQKPL